MIEAVRERLGGHGAGAKGAGKGPGKGGRPKGPGDEGARPAGFLASVARPLIYINMPKSGCTTIKNLLVRLDTGAFIDDPLTIHGRKDLLVHWKIQPETVAARLKTDFVFTFVRHPLKRSYSCFNEKIHFTSIYSFGKVRQYIAKNYGARFEDAPSLELHRENFKRFLRFSQDSVDRTNDMRRDPHWSPQSVVLAGSDRWRRPDFIGKVERFDAGMDAVLGLAGVARDFETPRMNEGPPPPWRYEEVIDDEIRAMGAKLFADDLRNFGYVI